MTEGELIEKVNNCPILKEANTKIWQMPDECDGCELRIPGWIWLCASLKRSKEENK